MAPIELSIQDDFIGSVAAYKQFDALFVNAIFDGMNLVAKEAPLVNERDGVLILSENAGAHAELGEWALTVNPFDVAGQAEAIHTALSMGESERRARLDGIRTHVREHDVAEWIESQLADLDRCRASRALELELLDDQEALSSRTIFSTSGFWWPSLITNQSSWVRICSYSSTGTITFSKQVSSPHSQTHSGSGAEKFDWMSATRSFTSRNSFSFSMIRSSRSMTPEPWYPAGLGSGS